MPNWCANDLTITGPKAEIEALEARVIVADPNPERSDYDPTQVLDYAVLLPEPAYATTQNPAGTLPDWYEWRLEHWGVKWNHPGLSTYECFPQGEDAELQLEFDTPWGPPIPFMEALAEAFPGLTYRLHYEEESNDVHGVWTHEPEEAA